MEPESDGQLKVKYVPAEVGVFTVIVHWNGILVKGQLFLLFYIKARAVQRSLLVLRVHSFV